MLERGDFIIPKRAANAAEIDALLRE